MGWGGVGWGGGEVPRPLQPEVSLLGVKLYIPLVCFHGTPYDIKGSPGLYVLMGPPTT